MVAESPGRFVLRFLIELGQLLDLRALSGIFAGDFRRGPDHFPFDVVGQMESDVLVGPIDQNEQAWLVGGEQLHGERSDRGIRPIRIMRRLSVRQEPVHAVGFLQQSDFAQSGEEILMVVEVPGLSQRYQPGSEVEQLELRGLLGAVQPIPIQPCGLIVLRVGVVVAVLRVAEFVAGKQHRRAQGEQQRAQHVHDGPFSLLCDDRITERAFMSEIDGMVVVAAVPVVLSVGFVVLMPILGQIGGGEAVVACHVVHGCGRSASGVGGEQIG